MAQSRNMLRFHRACVLVRPLRSLFSSSAARGQQRASSTALAQTLQEHTSVFGHKRSQDLLRLYFLLRVCRIRVISKNAYWLFTACQHRLGDRAFDLVFKPLVYNVFIAGNDASDVISSMQTMIQDTQLKPLLSPMLEDDPDAEDQGRNREEVRHSVHTKNVDTILKCVDVWQAFPEQQTKTLAIKLTAFLTVNHLEKIAQKLDCPLVEETFRSVDEEVSKKTETSAFSFTRSEWRDFQNGMGQLVKICETCRTRNVKLFIDAEQSHLQQAVRMLTLILMKRFNPPGREPLIMNTYQCYLQDSLSHVQEDLELSKRIGFELGLKVVRGAYMESEGRRSQLMGMPYPIWPTYEATNQNYDRVVSLLIEGHRAAPGSHTFVLVATHNRSSVLSAAHKLDDLLAESPESKDKLGRLIHFGQINGMGDQLSLGLARHGYSCLKLLPCGSVSEVLPWLARRMQENTDAVERTDEDLRLIAREMAERMANVFRRWPMRSSTQR